MNTTTTLSSRGTDATTISLQEGYFARRSLADWIFAALVLAGGLFAFAR
ncbi:MAG: c-type cytochrome biogenesis protein CcsB, partial [Polaromonas sp.]